MSANPRVKTKIPAKAKERAAQVNRLQRSSDEMGKFDNASATSVPMAIAALVGLGIEVLFYLFLLVFLISDSTKIFYDYFYERGWVPYILTYLACWSFAILFFKRKKLQTQQNVMQFKLLLRKFHKIFVRIIFGNSMRMSKNLDSIQNRVSC